MTTLRERLQQQHDAHLGRLRELCELRNQREKPQALRRWLRRAVRDEVAALRGLRADLAELDTAWARGEVAGLELARAVCVNQRTKKGTDTGIEMHLHHAREHLARVARPRRP